MNEPGWFCACDMHELCPVQILVGLRSDQMHYVDARSMWVALQLLATWSTGRKKLISHVYIRGDCHCPQLRQCPTWRVRPNMTSSFVSATATGGSPAVDSRHFS